MRRPSPVKPAARRWAALDVAPAGGLSRDAQVVWWRVFTSLYVRGIWRPEAAGLLGLLDSASDTCADYVRLAYAPVRTEETARLAEGARQLTVYQLITIGYLTPALMARYQSTRQAELLTWLATDL